MRTTIWVAACLFVSAAAVAMAADEPKKVSTAPQDMVYNAKSAFEFIKSMSGDWERTGGHDHGGTSKDNNFRLTAGGSSVMETIFPGEAMEMITVYHMDGDDLLLTHYCALQNAPVLKFEKTDKPGEIKFAFLGGTNFDPKTDMHVHEGVMNIKDANTIEASFIGFADGKPQPMLKSTMKRKVAAK